MRFTLVALLAALLAAVASAHTLNCWGKATHAPIKGVDRSIEILQMIVDGKFGGPPPEPGHENEKPIYDIRDLYNPAGHCSEVACHKGAQIRWCNDDDSKPRWMRIEHVFNAVKILRRDCRAVYKGKSVAGGQLNQPDKWSVVLQQDDKCEGRD